MVNRRNKAVKWVKTVQDIGRQLVGKKTARELGKGLNGLASRAAAAAVPSFKKGGKVTKTGLIRAHAGEVVLNKKTCCALKKLLK
jgi:hypothetical protein